MVKTALTPVDINQWFSFSFKVDGPRLAVTWKRAGNFVDLLRCEGSHS